MCNSEVEVRGKEKKLEDSGKENSCTEHYYLP